MGRAAWTLGESLSAGSLTDTMWSYSGFSHWSWDACLLGALDVFPPSSVDFGLLGLNFRQVGLGSSLVVPLLLFSPPSLSSLTCLGFLHSPAMLLLQLATLVLYVIKRNAPLFWCQDAVYETLLIEMRWLVGLFSVGLLHVLVNFLLFSLSLRLEVLSWSLDFLP
jgi:hypothetical protein